MLIWFFDVNVKSLDFENSVFFDKDIFKNRIIIDKCGIQKVIRDNEGFKGV